MHPLCDHHLRLLLFWPFVIYLSSSCSKIEDIGDRPTPSTITQTCSSGSNDLPESVLNLVKAECASCHPSVAEPDLTTEAAISANKAHVIRTVEDKSMPQGSTLSDEEIALISSWGAASLSLNKDEPQNTNEENLENEKDDQTNSQDATGTGTSASTSESSSEKVSYTGWVSTFITGNCISCHGAGTDYPLSSYEEVSALANSSLSTMQDGSMPPNSVSGEEDITKFSLWIDAGLPLSDDDDGC